MQPNKRSADGSMAKMTGASEGARPFADSVGEQRVSDETLRQILNWKQESTPEHSMAREIITLRAQSAAAASEWKALSVTAVAAENPSVAEYIASLEKRNETLSAAAAEEKESHGS